MLHFHPLESGKTGKATLHTRTLGIVLAVCLAGVMGLSSGTSNAQAPIRSTGMEEPIALTDQSTMTVNDDGTITEIVSAGVANYQDDAGSWQPIDNRFVPGSANSTALISTGNDYVAELPDDASEESVIFRASGTTIAMKLLGLDGAPQKTGVASAAYTDIRGAARVEYEATNEGLKETIVLDSTPTAPLVFSYVLNTEPGVEASLSSDGEVSFVTSAGLIVARIPAAMMFDAGPVPATSANITAELVKTAAETWTLTLNPDMAWLTAKDRVYPVRIDPTISDEPASVDCWLREELPNNKYCGDPSDFLRVGRLGAGERRRAILAFDPGVPAEATVDSATLFAYLDSGETSGSGSADFGVLRPGKEFQGASWNSSGTNGAWVGGDPSGTATGIRTLSGTASGFKAFDVTGIVQGWTAGSFPNTGLLVKQVSGENTNLALGFRSSSLLNAPADRPYLSVTYSLPPEIDGVSTTSVTSEEYAPDGTSISEVTTTTSDHGIREEPTADDGVLYKIESGGGGASSASGCRKVTLRNRKYSVSGTDHMYTYTTWTRWCWNRANRSTTLDYYGWDFYIDNESVVWDGQVKRETTYYDWISGNKFSGYRHYRKGHFHNEYPVIGTTGHSYPVNIIRSHSNGTWTWWTDD